MYLPSLVTKIVFLIVFWWFSHSKISGWLLDILVRDSFWLGVRGNLSLGPTRKSVRMAWKMLNKVARSCLCLIFPLVPVRPASSYHFNIQQSEGSGQPSRPKPAQQVNFRNYECLGAPPWILICVPSANISRNDPPVTDNTRADWEFSSGVVPSWSVVCWLFSADMKI